MALRSLPHRYHDHFLQGIICKPVRSYATPPREAAQPGVADEGPRARDAAVNCNPLRATPGVNKFTTARPQRGPRARVRAVNPNPLGFSARAER